MKQTFFQKHKKLHKNYIMRVAVKAFGIKICSLLPFLISTIFLFSVNSFGQGLILLDRTENDITNDDMMIYGEPTDLILKAEIYFKNTSGEDLPVLVRKIEIDVFPGTLNTFCWNGSCLSDQVFEVENPITLAPGETSEDNDFYAEYMPEGLSVTSIIKYEFFAPDNEFETVGVTVHYITGDDDENPNNIANLEDIESYFYSIFPNPASEYTIINYSIPNNVQNAFVKIVSITGKLLKEETLNPSVSNHIIDTSFLVNGIYLVSIYADKRLITTRKLIISVNNY